MAPHTNGCALVLHPSKGPQVHCRKKHLPSLRWSPWALSETRTYSTAKKSESPQRHCFFFCWLVTLISGKSGKKKHVRLVQVVNHQWQITMQIITRHSEHYTYSRDSTNYKWLLSSSEYLPKKKLARYVMNVDWSVPTLKSEGSKSIISQMIWQVPVFRQIYASFMRSSM